MKRLIVIAVLACVFPWVMQALDQHFYTSFATRILIYAMAAASLNLVLGYGGMVSFGIMGVFVGPVILAVAYVLLREWVDGLPEAAEETAAKPAVA